jgi:hypothetical protein
MRCKHFYRHETKKLSCAAFPDRIPDDILDSEFIHDKRHPGQDNDILFESSEEGGPRRQ